MTQAIVTGGIATGAGTLGVPAVAEPRPVGFIEGALARWAGALEEERGRWFLWLPAVFGCGIGYYFWIATEPPLILALAMCGVPLALLAARSNQPARLLAVAVLTLSAGFATAKLRTEWVRAPVLERPTKAIEAWGRIELIEPRPGRGVRLTLHLTKLGDHPSAGTPLRARIRTMAAAPDLRPGDAVRIMARLAPPAEPALPGGYDFARAAWFQSLGAVGYAMSPPVIDRAAGPPPPRLQWSGAVERFRHGIAERILAVLPGETGAIATALITGERGGISAETNDAFRNSGLLHILSISGLHMVVMAGAVFYGVRLILAGCPGIALRYPIKKWAALIAAIAALAYLLISGVAFATLRSYIMISIMFLAILLNRPAVAMRNVAISALLILALFPESLLDAGFQMSFAAVIALVAAYEWLAKRRADEDRAPPRMLVKPFLFLGGILLSTLVAGLAVAPFAAYHFHTSQQFALLANLIAIPICNILVMPAALLTLVLMPFGLEAPALWVMGQGIEGMSACARFAAGLPGAVLHVPEIPFIAFLMMVAGGLWLALWQARWRLAGLGAIALGAGLAPLAPRADLIAGREGALVAIRTEAGQLEALAGRQTGFELKRWLEHDGDGRSIAEVGSLKAFRCDGVGCVARVKGLSVAVVRHPAALADDCKAARILIIPVPTPKGCDDPAAVLDYYRLRDEGTHVLTIADDGTINTITVAQRRGTRPWTRPPRDTARRGQTAPITVLNSKPKESISRVRDFAPPLGLRASGEAPRPEIEDDGAFFDDAEN